MANASDAANTTPDVPSTTDAGPGRSPPTPRAPAAWSPAPDKPPFFFEIGTKDGVVQPDVVAQWAANAPNAMALQYVPALKSFTAIAMDIGDKDSLITGNEAMTDLLTRLGVAHSYAVYDGNHVDHVKERFKDFVLPFFAQHLATK